LNMTFTLNLLASSASEVDWSRPLMIGWIVVALGLGLIEIWLASNYLKRSDAENVKEVRT